MFRKGEIPLRMEKRQRGSWLYKSNEQELKSYCPIFLLLVLDRILERLLYSSMFSFSPGIV